ncbi:hypothetical protein EJ02DRAFT_461591 [Clathrospora elynae]|uniref:Uncharacterized protein n=1 Tax=Clathrospora elynae TaxID=706981 RepID=A0A6A5T6D5_9PLEO|nr:hypothetical protein EJ02DRAFT_461591 [Clathrospora elynae]
MSAMKRKFSADNNSDTTMSWATKKLKAASGAVSVHRKSDTEVENSSYAADDSADTYQLCGDEFEHRVLDTKTDAWRSVQQVLPVASRGEKQRLLEDQVGFVIIARDNNQPDPYGAQSTTHGPLPWPAVAELYNQKYKVTITPAAMEKRARQHRPAWLGKHPSYPNKILYATKVKILKSYHPQGITEKTRFRDPNATPDKMQARGGRVKKYMTNARIGGWLPPDEVRSNADINNYISHLR